MAENEWFAHRLGKETKNTQEINNFADKVENYFNESVEKMIDLTCPLCKSEKIETTIDRDVQHIYADHHARPIGIEIEDSILKIKCENCHFHFDMSVSDGRGKIFDKYKNEKVFLPPSLSKTSKAIKGALVSKAEEE